MLLGIEVHFFQLHSALFRYPSSDQRSSKVNLAAIRDHERFIYSYVDVTIFLNHSHFSRIAMFTY